MPCTTILVGKKASYDGSTLMARNEDSPNLSFESKKFIVVNPKDQPSVYKAVLSKVEITLPPDPVRYTAMPNANPKDGIWGEAGINEYNVAMSETETITSNPLVLGADPLVKDGIGEEDMLTIVLPYIKTAKEGVIRLGSLIEQYGTYEMNGIGFQDTNEIWWFESIGGHHWMAKRVPDESYVVMPNQLGIDNFDFDDALGKKESNICSKDLIDFIEKNHLNLMTHPTYAHFDTRAAFGSHSDSDHVYNTPRAWFMAKCLSPKTVKNLGIQPSDDNIPWSFVSEKKITVEDIKYVLSSYYQGTKYNPYSISGDTSEKGKFRPIGINRNNFVAITQLRPYAPKEIMAIEWIAVASNAFNTMIPFYTNVTDTPPYLRDTTDTVTTENFYWVNRIIGALADSQYGDCINHIERYQDYTMSKGHEFINETDIEYVKNKPKDIDSYLRSRNQQITDIIKKSTDETLSKVLYTVSCKMSNAFNRSDA